MKVLLLYPPLSQPFQPNLALPSLVSFLKSKGIKVYQQDLNIEFHHYFLSENFQEKISYNKKIKVKHYEILESQIKESLSIFKNPDYLDPYKFLKSIKIINNIYELHSLAFYPSRVDLNTFTSKYLRSISQDIIECSRNRKENPFIDFFEFTVINLVQKFDPSLIGVSITYDGQVIPGLTLCRIIKKIFPYIHITIGGAFFSKLITKLINLSILFEKFFDSVIYGEGELALYQLIQTLNNKSSFEKISNIVYKNKEKVIINPFTDLININELLTPDFDGLFLERYFSYKKFLPILSSRGCYWGKCTFCEHHSIYKKYRKRKKDLVIKDLKVLIDKYKITDFCFVDEAVSPLSLKDIANGIIKENLKITWSSEVRIEKSLDKNTCDKLYQSGCKVLYFGLESGSERVLKLMNKGTDISKIPLIYENVHKAEILNVSFIIVGFPTETKEEAIKTLKFILDNKKIIHIVSCSIFVLTLNSPIYKNPEYYDIEIINDSKRDLSLTFPFVSRKGMDSYQSEQILKFIEYNIWKEYNHPFWALVSNRNLYQTYTSHYGRDSFLMFNNISF